MESERVLRIKQLLESDQYRIDPYVIADAMIRWAGLSHEVPMPSRERQNECSNPSSGPLAPANTILGGPSITEPIQVRPALALGEL